MTFAEAIAKVGEIQRVLSSSIPAAHRKEWLAKFDAATDAAMAVAVGAEETGEVLQRALQRPVFGRARSRSLPPCSEAEQFRADWIYACGFLKEPERTRQVTVAESLEGMPLEFVRAARAQFNSRGENE